MRGYKYNERFSHERILVYIHHVICSKHSFSVMSINDVDAGLLTVNMWNIQA